MFSLTVGVVGFILGVVLADKVKGLYYKGKAKLLEWKNK